MGPAILRAAVVAIALAVLPYSSWVGAVEDHAPVAGGSVVPATPRAVAIDDPGTPYGWPDHNTFGYTRTFDNLDPLDSHSVWDVNGGTPPSTGELAVDVELGGFNRMHDVTDIADYWMDVDFTAKVYTWGLSGGRFCPAGSLTSPQLSPAQASALLQLCAGSNPSFDDDPCPVQPFPLFDVYIQPGGSQTRTLIRTVMGGQMQNCTPGVLSHDHGFQVLPPGDPAYPSDGPNRFRIPKQLLEQYVDGNKTVRVCCYATIIFKPRDLVLPAYGPFHDKAQDGVELLVHSVMIQLVAPPMVISHGWTTEVDPPVTGPNNGLITFVPQDPTQDPILWQSHLRSQLTSEFYQSFHQDPWDWARSKGREPVLLNEYDRKQDLRTSALQLGGAVTTLKSDMHWTGKVWMHGHSLGGLVSRYYIEHLGGMDKVEKLSQDASPNLGTFAANLYTWLHSQHYAEQNGTTLGHYLFGNSRTFKWYEPWGWWYSVGTFRCYVHVGFYQWKPWYEPNVSAYAQSCDDTFEWTGNTPIARPGQQRVADFELKPVLDNPILLSMAYEFFALSALPGSHPPYFALATTPNTVQPPGTLPPYFTVRASWNGLAFDQAVPFSSATLADAIPSRTINSAHENTPNEPVTARFLSRYYGNLDLDSGYPHFCRPAAPPGPGVVPNPGDAVSLNPGSIFADDRPDLRFEEYGGRAPSCPPAPPGLPACGAANEGDERDPTSTVGADAFHVYVDGQTFAKFSVHTALEEPPPQFEAVSPSGQVIGATTDMNGWTLDQTVDVAGPQPGQWTIRVAPRPGQHYYLALSWDSPLKLTASTLATTAAHAPVTITAKLKGPGVVVGQADVFAEVPDPLSGGLQHIPLQTSGSPANESWSATWHPPVTVGPTGQELACEGIFSVSVTATGNRGTVALPTPDFSRSVELEVHVEGDPADATACDPSAPPGPTGTPGVLVGVPIIGGLLLGGLGGGYLLGRRGRQRL